MTAPPDPANGDLAGARVLVTGAASGIGHAVAGRCLAAGADVGALDLDGERLTSAIADLRGIGGGRIARVVADVSDPGQVSRAVRQLADELGGLSAVVNVAGLGGYTGDVAETSLDAWQRTLAVNLTGVFLVTREALAFLRAEAGASVVNVSSQYGLVGGAGSPAYIASKAGVIGLTRAMAVDHAEENIRVNCVCPGPTDTPMLRADRGDSRHSIREDRRTKYRRLLAGVGTPEGVAGAIAFLLGPDAAEITGAVFSLDGGWTAS
jgi:NAD(P)-dependent dehydrogenase (short-subunit alcohol dehydrogenase family)